MVVQIADGKTIPLRRYLDIIQAAKQNPEQRFSRTFNSWAPGAGKEILWEFRRELQNVINRRGGLVIRDCNVDKPKYIERRRLAAKCCNCGGSIPKDQFHVNHDHRFCSDSCRRNY